MTTMGLIGVIRTQSTDECRTIVRGLLEGGVQWIEITMTVPDALRVVEEFASGAQIGVGTILDVVTCQRALDAGARFLVSPVTNAEVAGLAQAAQLPYVPGALTPNEVHTAMELGATAVKLFPADVLGGPAYVRTLREPFPDLRAVISGGVQASDFAPYIAAGAEGFCLGSAVIDREAAARGDIAGVALKARAVQAAYDAAMKEGS